MARLSRIVIPGAADAAIARGGRFGYTGQAWLPELGLWYYKARIYSPTLGRFMQTDPIGYEDQINLNAYVGNDPVNNVDPTGTEAEACPKDTICVTEQDSSRKHLTVRGRLTVRCRRAVLDPTGRSRGAGNYGDRCIFTYLLVMETQ